MLFAGCGGDGGDSPSAAELSGEFQAGRVSGLRYVTPTRSGITDANGTFKYLAGESVTFSVGAIQLGHVPGAPQITPFTLAGMTPPTTEPALRRELDRASRTTSNFVRAVNLMRLLMALDVDHDPANGLDLRGRDALLASATLNLDQPIVEFAAAVEKLAPDLTHNMPRWLPIVHLYRALGIAVPAHAPASQDSSYGGGTTQVTTYSYNPDGSLESQRSSYGAGEYRASIAYRYDALGRTTSRRTERLYDFWGSFADEEVTNYDVLGNLSSRTHDSDQGADGVIDVRQVSDFETDAFANVLGEVSSFDSGLDGTIDRVDRFSAEFDSRLNPDNSTWWSDSNMDGVTDQRTTWDVEFDASNRPLAELYEVDEDADGTIDSRDTNTFTLAANGRDISELRVSDLDADGIAEMRTRSDWVFDSGGVLRTLTVDGEYNFDEDENTSSTYHEVWTFDRDRRVLDVVTSEDWDGDGVDVVSRRVNSYDDHGNVLEAVNESDSEGDSQWDYRSVTAYEYGLGAELLGSTTTIQFSVDEPPISSGSTSITGNTLENGVLMLAQSYLEFRFNTGVVAVATDAF